jgi:hypothetical protein
MHQTYSQATTLMRTLLHRTLHAPCPGRSHGDRRCRGVSTSSPMIITVVSPANTDAVPRHFCIPHLRTVWVSSGRKITRPRLVHLREASATRRIRDSAAISVRHENAPPILRPDRIDGNAAGIKGAYDIVHAAQVIILAHPAQRLRDREKTGMGIQRDRPQNRVDDHEHQARDTDAEPQQCERQQRNRTSTP